MFSMLTLILGNNFLLMFVGWEGVGLCSYLLIGFYFKKGFAGDAAKKAFIFNRVGDFGFALGVMLLFLKSGSIFYFSDSASGIRGAFDWAMTQATEPLSASIIFAGGLTTIAVLLFVGATGKSAQIPLFVWLPDAMAGPTPVSALIHAATMVTAGVYMVARASSIYIHAPTAMMIVAIIGAATALFAATIGIAQSDIKKVLAYSTVSQLGYMFLACGVGRHLSCLHPRLLQSSALLRFGVGYHRDAPRTRYAEDGRLEKVYADYLFHNGCRMAGNLWNPFLFGLFQQRRNSLPHLYDENFRQ
jgi:NADH-quinone oxidoreductase subunit L